MHKGQPRVRYLDGLRGLAILPVVAWHYLGPVYAMHLPYGARYAALPGVGIGWAGVNLFFLISGYVIFMTLERCRGFGDFARRRFVRLFPAMLIASALIFAGSQAMAAEMPGGRARPIDLLPGLTLVNPIFYVRWIGLDVRSLDGAFWSLYVEAAFYLVIGSLFFVAGWARAVAGLLLLWATMLLMPPIAKMWHLVPVLAPPYRLLRWAGVGYFGWFASGALFRKAHAEDDCGLFAMALAIGLAASITTAMPDLVPKPMRLALGGCVLLFAAALRLESLQKLLELRPLLFVGGISYPLYLLHSALGVGLIAVLQTRSGLPAPTAIAAVFVALLALAWIVAARAEPWLAGRLTRLLVRRRLPDPTPAEASAPPPPTRIAA